ncbi:ankyrin repeat-containing domain protein [Yarrowia lipolytica]|uniref:Ankyrin repeat-containing domain protein n=1 Tax=Yarrowia lipolytica TaxID=4952 RepID=A0A371BY37_YARLL|nr:ankyrin repeat-containing domain protein [Yarrowia lipolytica]
MNIWVAASDGQLDVVKNFIENDGLSPNAKDENGYTPVHAAASYGHMDLLRYLIDKGGDINVTDEDGDTALHTVEELEVAKNLVEEFKADFKAKNSDGQTPFEKLQEEDEFPELIHYLAGLQGIVLDTPTAVSDDKEMPDVKYSFENEADTEADPEKKKQIEEIMKSDNPEAGLQEFLRNAINEQQAEHGEEKRRKE